MKNYLLLLLFAMTLLLMSTRAWAQSPDKVLDEADLARFVESYEPMYNDLVALDGPYAAHLDHVGYMKQFWKENAEFKTVLTKYGWAEASAEKFHAIHAAVGFLLNEKETLESVPPGQQSMVKQMFAEQRTQLEQEVSPGDIELVRGSLDALATAMGY